VRLLEAIIDANQRAPGGGAGALPAECAASLPLVALTCIDPRLNQPVPAALGVPSEQLIWVRNAGNVLTGPLSSTMRSLALACTAEGGREIAVIGHSDCRLARLGTLPLLESFAKLGVERSRLPENIGEFFGMVASERENVIKACETIRSSPIIGPKVPVHGLLLDLATSRLEWLVNGYETPASSVPSDFTSSLHSIMGKAQTVIGELQQFSLGDMKFPETKIGEAVTKAGEVVADLGDIVAAHPEARTPMQMAAAVAKDFVRHIVRTGAYKIVGDDKRQYGPISGEKLLQWIAEERVDGKTLVQPQGSHDWTPLEQLGDLRRKPTVSVPPAFQPKSGFRVKLPGRR
jgi:carbonic anhydrase